MRGKSRLPHHHLGEARAEVRQDEDAEKREDETQRDLCGDDVAGRPLRHLEGVRRLRGKDEHDDERRDEREVVDREQREGAPRPGLAGYERQDRHIDLSRAQCVEDSASFCHKIRKLHMFQ